MKISTNIISLISRRLTFKNKSAYGFSPKKIKKLSLETYKWWVVFSIIIVLIAVLVMYPHWQTERLVSIAPDRRLELEISARAALAQMMGGIVLIIGAYNAYRTFISTQENQITGRFNQAIEHLKSEDPFVRLGAIYILERISRDSEKDYWQVMEILSTYIRERVKYIDSEHIHLMTLDEKAALKVICRRQGTYGKDEVERIDLSNTDLRDATLREANLTGVNLSDSCLLKVDLTNALLDKSQLIRTNFGGAFLNSCSFKGAECVLSSFWAAIIWNANFRKANLIDVSLEGAGLVYTDFTSAKLSNVDFSGSDMVGTILRNASLHKSKFSHARKIVGVDVAGADFSDAYIKGVNVAGFVYLTADQQMQANLIDDYIPDYMQKLEVGSNPKKDDE